MTPTATATLPTERATRPLRLAVIADLNARPLWAALEADETVQLRKRTPAQAAGLLQAGVVDLALVPVVLAAERGWSRLPGLGIAARGKVGSVLVLSEKPLADLRVIYADEASRTSVVLLRVLLAEKGRTDVRVVPLPEAEARARVRTEAAAGALLIGDRALRARDAFPHAWDLAQAWNELTGLPFVFGVWASPGPVPAPVASKLVRAAKADFDPEAWPAPLAPAAARSYLANLHHDLDARDEAGLDRFLELARRHGFLPGDSSLAKAQIRPAARPRRLDPDQLIERALSGVRLDMDEALALHEKAPLPDLCAAADARRRELNPSNVVTYIVDRNINYTNICVTRCDFCAFYRLPGHAEGYVLSYETLAQKVEETRALGGRQILLQGGVNPELKIDYYEKLLAFLRARFPDVNVHGFSPEEIAFIAKVSALTVDETLDRLVAAGLGSLPGGGAEVLVDEVRDRIAPLKVTTDGWLSCMEKAQRRGLTTTATMMFGTGESTAERVEHLLRVRALQDETRGFTSFIPWTFQDQNTPMAAHDTGPSSYLRMVALSRLVLDNVPHLQASWVTQGPGVAQAALLAGCDDMGSIMIEENVVSAAGAHNRMNEVELRRQVEAAGFTPRRRNVHYQLQEEPALKRAPLRLETLA